MKVMLMIGMPASGKTTHAAPLAARLGYAYVCPDDIRREVAGDEGNKTRDTEVWALVRTRVARALEEGNNVLIDATFTNRERRRAFIKFARAAGARHVTGVFADVPLRIAEERNRKRARVVSAQGMREKSSELLASLPTLEDGFDSLVTLIQDVDKK